MRAILLTGCVALAAVAAVAGRDDDAEVKAAQKDIVALAKDLEQKGDIAKKAAAAAKKHELIDVMHAFKPRDKGGIGHGKKGAGIELTIIALAKRRLSAAGLKAESADVKKLAFTVEAIAEVTRGHGPAFAKGKVPWARETWDSFVKDMKTAAREMQTAAKRGESDEIQKAARTLERTCSDCHSDFRDGGKPRRPGGRFAVRTAVLDLASELADGKQAAKTADAAAKKVHFVMDLMAVFKERDKGGLGFGDEDDGLEETLSKLRKRESLGTEVRQQKGRLMRIARVSAAAGEIAGRLAPPQPLSAWRAREWRTLAADLAKAGRELEAAVKKEDAKKARAAAVKLSNACANCHADFRDR